ncbi:hypothetical protein [Cyanobium sp. CH-040]|uniref:hypothetical protein n=1 Tax=Cyanobium sp. CH-040 TaxID=2823708 RepID=UPI0020CBED0D|nr:hypothetical protein [Cyanobium sp. CH-040]MCP9926547.1 hypothetical protein [Cyanobium sp. CH-040]
MLPTCISDTAERRRRIAAATAGVVPDHWVTLRQGPRQVPRTPLAQELLLYRVDNGRLLAELQERLVNQPERRRHLVEQESEPGTQELLHDLLLEKARDPEGPILQELERLAVQTEPLLVDAAGVVVNGNRRLAAMRWLLAVDCERYARFQTPLAAVLPPEVQRADLEFIEAALQMAPETKLAYGWLDRRLKIREQRELLGLADAWIQEAYRMQQPEQLQRELAELKLAERYLKEVCGTPLRYSSIADAEPLFSGLCAQLAALPGRLSRPWRALGLLLIHQRQQLDTGLAKHFPFADPVASELPREVLARLAQDWGLVSGDPEASGSETLPKAVLRELAARAGAEAQRERHAVQVQDQLDATRLQLRQERIPQRLAENLHQVRRQLRKLDLSRLDRRERQRLRGELAALLTEAEPLLGGATTVQPGAQPGPLRRLLQGWRG